MTDATTQQGDIRGIELDSGIRRFSGIPYATPPVDELRWRPPVPAEAWTGVRDASGFGPVAPQNVDMFSMLLGLEPEDRSEDCLFVNVWTPGADDDARPVMVWIHGGAFMIGSGSMPLYSGEPFAQRGDVVLVTINYRLGEFGFLELGHLDAGYAGSGDIGLLDQIAALEWVRDNIAAFGGNPDDVTIFGESAGGMSVSSLLAAPAARGLFHKAIAQSGAGQGTSSPAQARAYADRWLDQAGVDSIEAVKALDHERIVEVQGELFAALVANPDLMLEAGDPLAGMPHRPVVDGEALPARVDDAVANGSAADVPLLIGTTLDEWKAFGAIDMAQVDEAELERRVGALAGAADADKVLAAYRSALPEGSPKDHFDAFMTDVCFRRPATTLAEAQLGNTDRVWSYLFSWPTPALGGMLGSCHALDIPFVFNVADHPKLAPFLGADVPEGLAAAMHDSWIAFARTGDPNVEGGVEWPAYDTERRATMDFGADLRVEDDPEADRRVFWESEAAG
jgi:para-nitrobenzyl esterase